MATPTWRCSHVALLLVATAACLSAQPVELANGTTSASCSANGNSSTPELRSSLEAWLNTTTASGVCAQAWRNLTTCANDDNRTDSNGISSLAATDCCSKPCVTAVEQALVTSGTDCYRAFLAALCSRNSSSTTNSTNNTLAEPLLSLARRCVGLNASCAALNDKPDSLLLPDSEARAALNSSAAAAAAAAAANGTGALAQPEAEASTAVLAAPATPDLPAVGPDPYKLLPAVEQAQQNVMLATPEEIEQAAVAEARRNAGRRLLLVAAAASTAAASAAAYDPARVVPSVSADCPVSNVRYPPEQYSTATLITMFAPLVQSVSRQECTQAATSLAVCAFDGSLGVRTGGCCSTACSEQMKQVNSLNCFPVILGAICQASPEQLTQVQPFVPVLASLAANCANYQTPAAINCPDGRSIAIGAAAASPDTTAAGAAEAPAPEMGAAAAAALPGAGAP